MEDERLSLRGSDLAVLAALCCVAALLLSTRCASTPEPQPEEPNEVVPEAEGPPSEPAPDIRDSSVIPPAKQRLVLSRLEAEQLVAEMFRSAVSYYNMEPIFTNPGSAPPPPQFPDPAPLTPAIRCCEQPEGRCVPYDTYPSGSWDRPSWQALNFAISDPHYLRYEFISDSAGFTARAVGDLDCDGELSTFERQGRVDSKGDIEGLGDLRAINENE